jgi:ribonuclease P/MRP protein subunit RPP40
MPMRFSFWFGNGLVLSVKKINLAGIDSKWFKSYLHERKQAVSVNNVKSSERIIVSGVPQGSILGPWSYLIFANDLHNSVSCKTVMYADDTILLVSHKNLDVVRQQLSDNTAICYHWLINNRLSMHMGKTECIVFSSKRKRHLIKSFNLMCNGHVIKAKAEVKYLGLKLSSLSGTEIVNGITSKCNSRLKFLHQYKGVLNTKCRKMLATALMQSHFDYGVSACYNGISKRCKKSCKLHKTNSYALF